MQPKQFDPESDSDSDADEHGRHWRTRQRH